MSINLLLAMHSSQTLSRAESRSRDNREKMKAYITENREEMKDGIENIKAGIPDTRRNLEEEQNRLSSRVASIDSSLLSLRNLSSQILYFIATFPMEIRDKLIRIIHQNNRVYSILLQIQGGITVSSTWKSESNIKFEDFLGRTRDLPYEYFR